MNIEEQIAEASDVITSLWTPDLIREVAEVGIITDLGGEVAIISSVDGAVLWRGGPALTLAWAVAFATAAKQHEETVKNSARKV
jgi:hypothetical protein